MILAELAALKAKVVNCRACGLRAGCQQVVFGEGYPGLMVIGEGPGADEDRLGRPFVGKAGQLLDKILASGGFDRHRNAYIANVVKCRPPGNRVPTPTECLACLPYLREQMYILQPKVVLLLGATALRGVLGVTEGITKARGTGLNRTASGICPPSIRRRFYGTPGGKLRSGPISNRSFGSTGNWWIRSIPARLFPLRRAKLREFDICRPDPVLFRRVQENIMR